MSCSLQGKNNASLLTSTPLTGQAPGDQVASHWEHQEKACNGKDGGGENCREKAFHHSLHKTTTRKEKNEA